MKHKMIQPYSFLRVLHAIPTSNSFDLYLDEELYAKDLLYEDFTIYKPLTKGEHVISICLHKDTEPLLTRTLWISPEKVYTLVVTYAPHSETLQCYLMNDPHKKIPEEHFLLRVGNFSQNLMPLQLRLVDTTPLFKKITSHQLSSYLSFSPATYTAELIDLDSKKTILTKANCTLKLSRYYTLYIIGGTKPFPTKLLLTIDGNSFLHFDQ